MNKKVEYKLKRKRNRLNKVGNAKLPMNATIKTIMGALTIVLLVFVFGKGTAFAISGGSSSSTVNGLRNIVESINQLGDGQTSTFILPIMKGGVIAGFSSGEPIRFRRSFGPFGHIIHVNEITKHPRTGVCSSSDSCLCMCTTSDYCKDNKGQCYALNSSIKRIYVVGKQNGINMGMNIPTLKDEYYLVLATTHLVSHQIKMDITRKSNEILITLTGVA